MPDQHPLIQYCIHATVVIFVVLSMTMKLGYAMWVAGLPIVVLVYFWMYCGLRAAFIAGIVALVGWAYVLGSIISQHLHGG